MIPRKRFISSLVWSVVGLAVPVQAQTPQFKNALQALYTMADSHNATLRSLQSAVVEAEAGVRSAEAAKLPDVSGQVSFSYLGNALQRHTGLQKSALAVDMSRTREKLERAELLPHVALLAEDHLDGPITTEVPPINKNINYWFVGVGVTYNFSSLYKNNRKLRQARLATAVAQDRRSVTLEEVGDAVHAAYVELGTARTALVTRQKSVQLALENYDVVCKRYANGLALITDLTDAAAMKLDAELALADARIELLYSLYRLKFAAGDL